MITATNNTSLKNYNLYLQEDMVVSVIEQTFFEKCVVKVVPLLMQTTNNFVKAFKNVGGTHSLRQSEFNQFLGQEYTRAMKVGKFKSDTDDIKIIILVIKNEENIMFASYRNTWKYCEVILKTIVFLKMGGVYNCFAAMMESNVRENLLMETTNMLLFTLLLIKSL